MKYLLWLLLFIPALIVEGLAWLTNPIVCLWVRKEPRTDTVKRLNRGTFTFDREYLLDRFMLWQTHDNAVDEGWWGLYDIKLLRGKNQADYDTTWWIRYYARLWWLARNTAYGFHYAWFSRPFEEPIQIIEKGVKDTIGWSRLTIRPSSWQYQALKPFWFGKVNSINIGWKAHKGMPKLLYANRPIGLRNK